MKFSYFIVLWLIGISLMFYGCSPSEYHRWVILDKVNLPAERLVLPICVQLNNGEEVFLNPTFAIDIISVVADNVVINPKEVFTLYDAGLDTSTKKIDSKSFVYQIPFELTDDNKSIVFMTAKDVTDDNYRLFIYEIPVSASRIKIEYRLRTSGRVISEVFCLSFDFKFAISRKITNDIVNKH